MRGRAVLQASCLTAASYAAPVVALHPPVPSPAPARTARRREVVEAAPAPQDEAQQPHQRAARIIKDASALDVAPAVVRRPIEPLDSLVAAGSPTSHAKQRPGRWWHPVRAAPYLHFTRCSRVRPMAGFVAKVRHEARGPHAHTALDATRSSPPHCKGALRCCSTPHWHRRHSRTRAEPSCPAPTRPAPPSRCSGRCGWRASCCCRTRGRCPSGSRCWRPSARRPSGASGCSSSAPPCTAPPPRQAPRSDCPAGTSPAATHHHHPHQSCQQQAQQQGSRLRHTSRQAATPLGSGGRPRAGPSNSSSSSSSSRTQAGQRPACRPATCAGARGCWLTLAHPARPHRRRGRRRPRRRRSSLQRSSRAGPTSPQR